MSTNKITHPHYSFPVRPGFLLFITLIVMFVVFSQSITWQRQGQRMLSTDLPPMTLKGKNPSPKLSGEKLQTLYTLFQSDSNQAETYARQQFDMEGDLIRIVVTSEDQSGFSRLFRTIESLGGKIQAQAYPQLEVFIPLSAMPLLIENEDVSTILEPFPLYTMERFEGTQP